MQRDSEGLASPFLSPEFAVAVGQFRADARVAVLTDGPVTAGFFPFQRRRLGVGVPIGAGLNDCQGLIHVPGLDWDERELLGACKLSVWQFDNLAGGQRQFGRHATAVAPAPVVDLAAGFAGYAERLRQEHPSFWRHAARQARRLERQAGELHQVADSPDPAGLRALMRWKSAQCRRAGWVDLFAQRWVAGTVEYLFHTRSPEFGGLLSLSYAGGELTSADFGIRRDRILAGWFTAYDARFGTFSPGTIGLLRMLEQLPGLGITVYSMGRGDEPYKQKLKTGDLTVAAGMAARSQAAWRAHSLRRAAYGRARRWVRRHPAALRAADLLARRYGRLAD